VIPLTRAAIAAGADGIMIDVHPAPCDALCDGRQALVTEDLAELADSVKQLAAATGRAVTRHPGTQIATALRSG
jgi:3-deoxy-7-phosphoheptulonate synthase